MTIHTLGIKGAEAFENRGLSLETAARLGIYTGRHTGDDGVVPDAGGNIVVFPFVDHGVVVAEKYRAPGKKFWQRAGGKRTFWNADVLDDPAIVRGDYAAIITEGELDAITAIDCGFPFTVSVPDGAPAVQPGEDPAVTQAIIEEREASGKFEFMWNNRDRLKRIKRFIIATDNDPPGQRLAAELVRRLSAAKCLFVSYPDGCKDLNDVLRQHGRDAVSAVLNGAKPYPLKGVYQLVDYPAGAPMLTYPVGWETLDRYCSLWIGELLVVTGIPNHGKSTFVTHVLVNLAEAYGWRTAIFSPEMPVVPQYRDKLRRIRLRRPPQDGREADQADVWINEHFRFIDNGPLEDLNEDATVEWVVDRAIDAVIRDGVRVLLIDPWNELDSSRMPNESMPDFIGRAIRMLKRFAKERQVVVIIVAHPTKEVGREGKGRMPTPYDIEGSAHWYNKPDHVLVVHRPNETVNETEIRIAKVRFEESGEKGLISLRFDKWSSRYSLMDERV